MATGFIGPLTPGSATPPDNSAGNLPAGVTRVKSSAAAPSIHDVQAFFDGATLKEWLHWKTELPGNAAASAGLVAKVKYKMASGVSGGIALEVRVAAITPGDATDADAKAYAAANVGTDTVPGTAGHVDLVSITLTNSDNAAAGDVLWIALARDPAHASDTAAGDLELIDVMLEYTI